MDITYRIKDLAELAAFFQEKADALRTEMPKRKWERQYNEAMADAYDEVAKTMRNTVVEKS